MPAHGHSQIRDAVKTRLTGLSRTGSRVFANRVHPLTEAELPALRVFLDEETAEPLAIHSPHPQQRHLILVVEACAKANAALDDSLDQIGLEVETAMSSALTVGGAQIEPIYLGMSHQDDFTDKPVGVKRLRYRLTWAAMNNAADILI